jgi:CheY-like chemotaxis protein
MADSKLTGASHARPDRTLLVVEDNPTVRTLLTEALEELGYTVIAAADGPAGLEVLRSDVRLDLVITDVGLRKGMNGRQMADAGRALRPDLKVLFITGYSDTTVLGDDYLPIGMHLLTKPFGLEDLADRIKDLIGPERLTHSNKPS